MDVQVSCTEIKKPKMPVAEICLSLTYVFFFKVLITFLYAAILKAADFSEVDRAECQFTTTATILDNGTQVS